MKWDIEVLRKYLSAASQRSGALDEEFIRSNLVRYNFLPINHAVYTLNEETIKTLNKGIPNLSLSRSDVKYVFRI